MTDRLTAALVELADAIRAEVRAELAAPGSDAADRLLSIDEAAATLGLGRTALYGELQAGRLRSIAIGRRRLVPAGAIREFIASAEDRRASVARPI